MGLALAPMQAGMGIWRRGGGAEEKLQALVLVVAVAVAWITSQQPRSNSSRSNSSRTSHCGLTHLSSLYCGLFLLLFCLFTRSGALTAPTPAGGWIWNGDLEAAAIRA